MGRIKDTAANDVLDLLFGAVTPAVSGDYQIGLSTTTPDNAGSNINEPAGNGYARVPIINDMTTWAPAASRLKQNAIAFTFPTATGPWGLVTHFVIYDFSGNFFAWGQLSGSQDVQVGATPSFPPGSMIIDSPGA